MTSSLRPPPSRVLDRRDFPRLFEALRRRQFRILGPTVRDGAIVYDELQADTDLPIGWTDEQNGGVYRLVRRGDAALFGYVVGPHTWKKFLLPPEQRLWSAQRTGQAMTFQAEPPDTRAVAFLGVRACELRAMEIQDKVLLKGPQTDPHYRARREHAFVIAVNCGHVGGTCFCTSMGTGPKAVSGYDLALTEVIDASRHYFVVEARSEPGAAVLAELPNVQATEPELAAAAAVSRDAAGRMGRQMDAADLRDLLARNGEHPRWDQVAARCLTCANCTMVCPTCFCTNVEDVTDLTGDHAERWRKWDSCFTMDFSHIHGGSIRPSARSRYRQWLTHKLGAWHDQFGVSGCVGCGRCITWCPVGIDITAEIRAIREGEPSHGNA